jgi:hypothetical protein
MTILHLPHADFFDSVEPLESVLERAKALFFPSPSMTVSLPFFMMWQEDFAYALAIKGNASFILALYGHYVYLPVPPKPFTRETLETALDFMRRVNGLGRGISRIEGLTEEQKELADSWRLDTRPTLTEYVYDRERLAGLHGDPYRAKRAEINHLIKGSQVLLRPYRATDLMACGDLFEHWKEQRLPTFREELGAKMLISSQKAHFHALHEGEYWGMEAWVVLVDGRLAAYCAGAPLNLKTYGIFLEVTDLTVKGLSAYIFANVCWQLEGYTFINTGDAEGLPRLAESKEHWHPVQRLELYAVDPE